MQIVAVRLEVHIPRSRSLKEKRAVLKPLVEGLRQRFALSVAEVGFQDKWQRAEVGLAMVSSSPAHGRDVVEEVQRWVWARSDLEVLAFEVDWLEFGDSDFGDSDFGDSDFGDSDFDG